MQSFNTCIGHVGEKDLSGFANEVPPKRISFRIWILLNVFNTYSFLHSQDKLAKNSWFSFACLDYPMKLQQYVPRLNKTQAHIPGPNKLVMLLKDRPEVRSSIFTLTSTEGILAWCTDIPEEIPEETELDKAFKKALDDYWLDIESGYDQHPVMPDVRKYAF